MKCWKVPNLAKKPFSKTKEKKFNIWSFDQFWEVGKSKKILALLCILHLMALIDEQGFRKVVCLWQACLCYLQDP